MAYNPVQSMKDRLARNHRSGFTLIEMMVAIAVLAIVGTAIYHANNRAVVQQQQLEEKTVATWILTNAINEYSIQYRIDPSSVSLTDRESHLTLGGRDYVVRVSTSNTDSDDILKFTAELYVISSSGKEQYIHRINGYHWR